MSYCNHNGTIERCEFIAKCDLCVLHSEYNVLKLVVPEIIQKNK